MDWIKQYKSSVTIVALALALPLAIALYVVLGFWQLGQGYQTEVDQLLPKAARLMGMVASEEQLADSVAVADSMLAELVYASEAEVSTSLQRDLQELIIASDMKVTNSRILTSAEFDNFEKIEFQFSIEGSMTAFDRVLTELAAFEPLVLVESMEIHPNRILPNRPEFSTQRITATIVLLSLKALP